MKILHLKMKAFLAYKDEIDIDFTLNEGLYLINGPTGSGKTTIFDAIVFALYGQSSGIRGQMSLRSDYADVKDETYVELTFEVLGHLYTIRRTPTYKREGYKTLKQATALLKLDNNQYIEGTKDVNTKIIEILGINYEQFKQIVMISQGEFTKLIYANSDEREKVLRRIFNTYSLLDIENILKDKVREYKEKYDVSSQVLSSSLKMLQSDENYEVFYPSLLDTIKTDIIKLKEENKQLEQNYLNKEKKYNELSKDYTLKVLMNEKIEKLEDYNKQYHLLTQKQDEINGLEREIKILQNISQNQNLILSYKLEKEQYTHNHQNYLKAVKKQENVKQEYNQYKEKYLSLQELRKEKEELNINVNELKQTIEKQKKHNNYSKIYREKKQQLDKEEIIYKKQITEKEKFATRMQRDQQKVNELPDLLVELKEMDQAVQQNNEKRILIHELSELNDHLRDEQEKHYALSNTYNKACKVYKEAYENYQYQDELYKRQQAGILALELQDDTPCPVCGSLHHPAPAQVQEHVLSASQLSKLSKELNQLLRDKEEAYQQVVTQNELKAQAITKLSLFKKQLNIEGELNKRVFIEHLSAITQILQDRKKKYQRLYQQTEYLKKLRHSLDKDQVVLEEREKELNILFEKLEVKRNDIIYLEGMMKEYEGMFEENLEEQYQNSIKKYKELSNTIEEIEKGYLKAEREMISLNQSVEHYFQIIQKSKDILKQKEEQYYDYIEKNFNNEEEFIKYYSLLSMKEKKEKEYNQYLIHKEKLLNQIEILNKEVENHNVEDLQKAKEKVDQYKEERDHLQKVYHQMIMKVDNNTKVYQTLKKEYEKNKNVLNKYQHYLHLSDITSGKNNMRMSFERYVLSFYFENILQYANIEFAAMSQGRYQFIRKTEVKGNSKQGLELSILDYETGVQRDVQSLSGGESFKAALSLALGLSSMIQSYVGGIELNTLFVDEGFGTLDEESLNQAIDVLMKLGNNKVIGIISHVNELKEKIDNKIIVKKGKQGSYLKVEFQPN
ncbi:MAG: SMC family ATPase [Bacilli bacterium]|nr:SMC family ATPase [Bacilli bacterium]